MKNCNNCGNNDCYTRNNCLGEFHTSPPCTGWMSVKNNVKFMTMGDLAERLEKERPDIIDELMESYDSYED